MGTPLPKYWINSEEPEAGVYRLISLAGWHPGDGRHEVFMIVESLNGYLTEAFTSREQGRKWNWITDHGASKYPEVQQYFQKQESDMAWKEIDDTKVVHVWQDPETKEEINVFPDFYQDNGTPLADNGEDCVYLRTEINLDAE